MTLPALRCFDIWGGYPTQHPLTATPTPIDLPEKGATPPTGYPQESYQGMIPSALTDLDACEQWIKVLASREISHFDIKADILPVIDERLRSALYCPFPQDINIPLYLKDILKKKSLNLAFMVSRNNYLSLGLFLLSEEAGNPHGLPFIRLLNDALDLNDQHLLGEALLYAQNMETNFYFIDAEKSDLFNQHIRNLLDCLFSQNSLDGIVIDSKIKQGALLTDKRHKYHAKIIRRHVITVDSSFSQN
jgi:hypothetical protein